MNSSYESLVGGTTNEATENFTGGVTELIDFQELIPANLFQIMLKANERESLMGCATPVSVKHIKVFSLNSYHMW